VSWEYDYHFKKNAFNFTDMSEVLDLHGMNKIASLHGTFI